MERVLFTSRQKDSKMGFIQKLAKRNPRVYKQNDVKKPNMIVKDNVAYVKMKDKKKGLLYYINPKNW